MSLSTLLFDSPNERLEHIVASETLTPVKSKRVFVQVHLQILRANVLIDAANAVLGQAPEAFNRVSVDVARDIDLLRMVHPSVLVAAASKMIILRCFIGKDDRCCHHSFLDGSADVTDPRAKRQNLDAHAPSALNHAKHGSFLHTMVLAALVGVLVRSFAAVVPFIDFDLPA